MDVLIRHTPRGFLRVIGASLALHVAVIVVGLIVFKAGPRKVFFTPVYTVNLVDPAAVKRPKARPAPAKKQAVKKAAPKKKAAVEVKKAAPKAVKTSQLAPEKAKKAAEAVSLEESLKKIREDVKRQEEERLLAERIEELKKEQQASTEEVQKSLEEIKKELAAAAAATEETAEVPPRAGTRSAGPRQAVTSANLEVRYPAYLSAIRDKVQDNWVYPETFKRTKSAVIVSVKIGKEGELVDIWIEQSSGLERFDKSLVNAVRKAAPFPPHPVDFEEAIFETGLRFCPECTE